MDLEEQLRQTPADDVTRALLIRAADEIARWKAACDAGATLPCEVMIAPHTVIGRGVSISTLMLAISRRVGIDDPEVLKIQRDRTEIMRQAFQRAASRARMHGHHALWAGLLNHGWDEATERFGIGLANRIRDAILEEIPLGLASYQDRVKPWLDACFGEQIAIDKIERNHRFLEEALELVQSTGCTASEAHQLVDYVFCREPGDRDQEVGGVMNTLAALCLAHGHDMHDAGERELVRVWGKIEKIRAKQKAKPKHSPLPASPAREATPAMLAAAWAAWHSRHGGNLGPGPAFKEAIEAALNSE